MSRQYNRRRLTGGMKPVVVIAALLIIGSALLAYKYAFHRAGEEATTLIPSDAVLVVTADLGPSPDQVVLFNQISRSLVDEKVEEPFESAISDSANGSKFLKDLRPSLGKSYAFATLKKSVGKPGDDYDYVGLAAIADPKEVEAVEGRHGSLEHSGDLAYYRIKGEKVCSCVIRQYLVVSNDPGPLQRILAVSNGQGKPISSVDGYKDARARLPLSPNVMAFGDVSALNDAAKTMFAATNQSTFKPTGWAAVGATLRNTGIEISWNWPSTGSPLESVIKSVKPIESSAFSRLPAGAFGFLMISQPGVYYSAKDADLGLTADQKKAMNDGIASFEKETGIDIRRDLVSGLTGNLTLAIYPAKDPLQDMPDGLLLMDDANGANPSATVEKIKTVIADECRKNHWDAPLYKSENLGKGVIWSLDDKTQKSITDSMQIKQQAGAEPKQLMFATIGNAVVLTTARSLVERAIQSYSSGQDSIGSDPGYKQMLKQLVTGPQQAWMIDIPGILQHYKGSLTDSLSGGTGPTINDILPICGDRGNGLVYSQGFQDGKIEGLLFLPINYEKVIHLIGLSNAKQKGVKNEQHDL